MKKLIVIEGFDRSGKDTLMKDLSNIELKNTYIYFNDLEGLPKYDKEQENFLIWLNRFIQIQINKLNELFNSYDTIIMTRFIVTDEIYSTLFNREHTVIKYINLLKKDVEIINYCLLFDTWNDYIKRLRLIGEKEIQYDNKNFEEINALYLKFLLKYEKFKIKYVNYNTSEKEILIDFLNYFFKLCK